MANICTLDQVHTYLQILDGNTNYDSTLQWLMNAADEVIRYECDDILPKLYDERYDGGEFRIYTRHVPIYRVLNVEEGWGFTNYELDFQEVNSAPDTQGIFGYSIDSYENGEISRRSAASVAIPFVEGEKNIHVTYEAGLLEIPGNVFLAELELISHWFQNTQLRGVSMTGTTQFAYDATSGAAYTRDTESGEQNFNIGVPFRILELIKSHRRRPFIA